MLMFQPVAIKNILFRGALAFCLCFLSLTVLAGNFPPQNSNYLDSVDYYLKNATGFTNKALTAINKELDTLDRLTVDKQLEALARIGKRLEQIDINSAIKVYHRGAQLAEETGNSRYRTIFKYRNGSVLPMMGLIRSGIDAFSAVSSDELDSRDKLDYFSTGVHIFDAIADYYTVDSLKQRYKIMSKTCTDSILAYVEPSTHEAIYYKALPKLSGAAYKEGIEELVGLLKQLPNESPLFAKAAAEIASAYMKVNDLTNARYYLALSAIGDLMAGTRETTSLHRLGKILNYEEDFQRAYEYLTYSLESAVSSGSNMRTIEISEIMPAVVKATKQIETRRQRLLITTILSISIALIISIAMIIVAFRTRNKLRNARKSLVSINDSKDLYIRKLIQLCGAYLSALENFNKLAGRKIKVGQTNELLNMIESGKVIREQLQSFYEVFDEAFLTVYPDFVENVNKLLLPDKQLSLNDDGYLGTELRIVAFMRLGMDDSAQIARFLGLSLNTIYTYRNKVKTRAVNRNTFETDIHNIGRHIDA